MPDDFDNQIQCEEFYHGISHRELHSMTVEDVELLWGAMGISEQQLIGMKEL